MRSTYPREPRRPNNWLGRQAAPATITFMALMLAGAVLGFFSPGKQFVILAVDTAHLSQVWGFVTHPMAGYLPSGLSWFFWIFFMVFFYQTSMGVENDLGIAKYAGFVVAMAALSGLIVALGAVALNLPRTAYGGDIAVMSAVIIAWCTRHSDAPVGFMGIPLAARWLGWIMVVIAFTHYGAFSPTLGLLACLHLPFAHLFAANRLPGSRYSRPIAEPGPSKAQRAKEAAFFDDVRKREQEREERERLRKLFESSLEDEK